MPRQSEIGQEFLACFQTQDCNEVSLSDGRLSRSSEDRDLFGPEGNERHQGIGIHLSMACNGHIVVLLVRKRSSTNSRLIIRTVVVGMGTTAMMMLLLK